MNGLLNLDHFERQEEENDASIRQNYSRAFQNTTGRLSTTTASQDIEGKVISRLMSSGRITEFLGMSLYTTISTASWERRKRFALCDDMPI